MQALSGARGALRRAATAPAAQPQAMGATRRGMATEPEVAWADYRSGKVTLSEWVDGNRHKVAGSFVAFYAGLLAWNLRPGKKKAKKEAVEVAAEPAAKSG